jgi:hypothetical protein
MQQGQVVRRFSSGSSRPGLGHRVAMTVAIVATLASSCVGAAIPGASAGASGRSVKAGPATTGTTSTTSTTSTTVVSPTTTVTTTTLPQSVTTATTTVNTTPSSVTSTTVTTVTPTTVTPTKVTPTTVPSAPIKASTTTTSTTVPTATTTTTSAVPGSAPVAPTTTTPPPPPALFDSTCSQAATPTLQTYLDSLPDGSVFRSSTTACYLVPTGIRLTHPITLVGGTFFDPTNVRSTSNGIVYNGLKPIILIKDTTKVTLEQVNVLGVNTAGDYHSSLVGQAGVKIMASSDVTLTQVTARNTYGDGLELVADATNHVRISVTGLTVHGFTTVNAGRQGVTVAEASGALLDHVTITNPAASGFDFESDLPGIGSSNVTISNCVDDHGFSLIEFFSGPITVINCTEFHHVTLGSLHSNAPINFVGGTLTCKRAVPTPCIKQTGGSLTFTGVTINRMPGTIKISTPTWEVTGGGSLAFMRSPISILTGYVIPPATLSFSN